MQLNYLNYEYPATNQKPPKLFHGRKINTGLQTITIETSLLYEEAKSHHAKYADNAKQTADKRAKLKKFAQTWLPSKTTEHNSLIIV